MRSGYDIFCHGGRKVLDSLPALTQDYLLVGRRNFDYAAPTEDFTAQLVNDDAGLRARPRRAGRHPDADGAGGDLLEAAVGAGPEELVSGGTQARKTTLSV